MCDIFDIDASTHKKVFQFGTQITNCYYNQFKIYRFPCATLEQNEQNLMPSYLENSWLWHFISLIRA